MSQDVSIQFLYQVKLHYCTHIFSIFTAMQNLAFIPKDSSDKTKIQAMLGHRLVSSETAAEESHKCSQGITGLHAN